MIKIHVYENEERIINRKGKDTEIGELIATLIEKYQPQNIQRTNNGYKVIKWQKIKKTKIRMKTKIMNKA